MLLKYNVSNYKSIGHEIEFSMFPTSSKIDEKYTKVLNTKVGDWKILKRGAFFGPNASGKSSFVQSIHFAIEYIVNGMASGQGTNINQFRGTFKELDGQSLFTFMFYAENKEIYEYGFCLDSKQVCEEWLMVLTKKGFEPMFFRQTNNEGKTEIEIRSKLARKNSRDKELCDLLKQTIKEKQKNQLFLYKLYDNGVKKVEPVMEWFKSIQVIFPGSKVQFLPLRLSQNIDLREFISDCLKKMDTGVVKLSTESEEMDFHEFIDKVHLPRKLVSNIQEQRNGMFKIGGKYYIFGEKQGDRLTIIQLKFEHTLNAKSIDFDLEDESDGTQRLLDLLPMLFVVERQDISIFVVDELDRSLHTKLSKYFLKLFLDNSEYSHGQIIYTAHDVNLIDLNNFAQDEIWFVEKKHTGESTIKPLSDFNVTEGRDVLKAYLNGRFGAVPVIKGE